MQTQNTYPVCKRNLRGHSVLPPLHPDDVLAGEGITINFIARLMGKVRLTETCWTWNGALGSSENGRILRGRRKGGNITAKRGIWLVYNGAIPTNADVYRCCPFGNPRCIHPNHIRLTGQQAPSAHTPLSMAQIIRFELLREQSGLAISELNALQQHTHQTPEWMLREGFAESFAHRFWTRVNKTNDCWLWTGPVNDDGYGAIGIGGGPNTYTVSAHRASWMLHSGPIPEGLKVRHLCPNAPNPRCVNPAHLAVGTHQQNVEDAMRLMRAAQKAHWTARLTVDQVKEIRRLSASGLTNVAVGRQFGVTPAYVSRIKHRLSWKHII